MNKKLKTYGGTLPIEEAMGILMHEINRSTTYIKHIASEKIQIDSSVALIEKELDKFYKIFSETQHPSNLEEENKRLKEEIESLRESNKNLSAMYQNLLNAVKK